MLRGEGGRPRAGPAPPADRRRARPAHARVGPDRRGPRRRPQRPGLPGMSVVGAPMRDYYERRAREYDDWWLGSGRFARRERPGWHDEVHELTALLGALPPR